MQSQGELFCGTVEKQIGQQVLKQVVNTSSALLEKVGITLLMVELGTQPGQMKDHNQETLRSLFCCGHDGLDHLTGHICMPADGNLYS